MRDATRSATAALGRSGSIVLFMAAIIHALQQVRINLPLVHAPLICGMV